MRSGAGWSITCATSFLAPLERPTPWCHFFSAPARDLSGIGSQTLAISFLREMVLQALRATGYEEVLAERMAQEIAESVPTVQEKVRSAA